MHRGLAREVVMKTILLLLFLSVVPTSVSAVELDVVVLLDTSDSTRTTRQVLPDEGSAYAMSVDFSTVLRSAAADVIRAVPVLPTPVSVSAYNWGASLDAELLPRTPVVHEVASMQLAEVFLDAGLSIASDGTDLPTSIASYMDTSYALQCGVLAVVTHDTTAGLDQLGPLLDSLPESIEVHVLLYPDNGYESHLSMYRQVIPLTSRHTVGVLNPLSAPRLLTEALERTAKYCTAHSS